MHRLKLLGFALIAVFAVGAMTASIASAAEAGSLLLVLEGEKVSELKFTGEALEFEKTLPMLENAAGEKIACQHVGTTASFEAEAGKPADAEKGKAEFKYTGCKKEEVTCRTGTVAEEVVLATPILGYAGLNSAKELVYGLAIKVTPNIRVKCGVINIEIGTEKPEEGKKAGNLGCVVGPQTQTLTEVAEDTTFTILCQQSKGVQINQPTCVKNATTCKELEEKLAAAFNGKEFKAVGELIHVKGSFNKMVFLDD